MQIIRIDNTVRKIDASKIALIRRVFNKYPCKENVYLDETIFGHIAEIYIEDGRFIPGREDTPQRLDMDDIKFWAQLAPKLRWFEHGHGVINIAF